MVARCLLLDLDGTLVDSVPDLAASLNRLAAARGLNAPFTEAELVPMIGDGAPPLVRRAFSARGREATPADIDAMIADYTAHAAEHSHLYPGVRDILTAMHEAGWVLAVCTNKPVAAAREVLTALGLDALLAAVGGGDSFAVKKPDPGHLMATLALAGVEARRAVMLGDHHNDIAAARAAGIACIFAAWGYGPIAMADGAPLAATMADVPALANGLVPA